MATLTGLAPPPRVTGLSDPNAGMPAGSTPMPAPISPYAGLSTNVQSQAAKIQLLIDKAKAKGNQGLVTKRQGKLDSLLSSSGYWAPTPPVDTYNPGAVGDSAGGTGFGARTTNAADLAKNYPGYKPGAISYDPNNPSQTLADIVKREQGRFDAFYAPVEDQLIGKLNDKSLITDARAQANAGFDNEQARTLRQNSRYGISLTPAEAAQQNKTTALAKSSNYDATVNDARVNQLERNDTLRTQLVNIGRGVAGEATDALGTASANQAQLTAQNRNAKTAQKAAGSQTVAQLGAAALMFLLA